MCGRCRSRPTASGSPSSATGPSGNGVYLMTPADTAPTKLWFQGSVAAWFPDSQRVVFSRQGDLWAMRVGSTEATQITKDKEDERAPVVSPDGKWIAFYSARSGHQDIWLVPSDGSAPSKQLTQAANAEDDPRFAPAWSPDSKQIAYISNKADYWHDDVWVIDVASGKPRQLSKSLMAASTPAWSPDGKSIALLGTAKKGYWYEDLQDIWIIDALKGTERTVKMQITATDWLHSLPIYWSGDGQRFYFVVSRARRSQSLVGAVGGRRGDQADERARHAAFVRDHRQRRRVRLRAFRPGRADRRRSTCRAIGGPPRRLTRFAETWEGVREPQEIAYRSFDGLYIQGFLYLPPNMREGAKYPALVQVHGGGTNSYLRTQNLLEHYLASKGYVVMAINYRGGSGFGRDFQDLGVNDWASGQAHDAAVAADFMRSLPYVNGKVGIYGYSYGGIMTMATIARLSGQVRRGGADGRHLRLRRRADQRRSPRQDLHADRTRRRSRRAQGGLRPQQHAGAREGRQDAAPHHARRGRRARAVQAVSAGSGHPEEDRQDVREQELSGRAARLPRTRRTASTCISGSRRSSTSPQVRFRGSGVQEFRVLGPGLVPEVRPSAVRVPRSLNQQRSSLSRSIRTRETSSAVRAAMSSRMWIVSPGRMVRGSGKRIQSRSTMPPSSSRRCTPSCTKPPRRNGPFSQTVSPVFDSDRSITPGCGWPTTSIVAWIRRGARLSGGTLSPVDPDVFDRDAAIPRTAARSNTRRRRRR